MVDKKTPVWEDRAVLDAKTLSMLRGMEVLRILYNTGVQLHRPLVTAAIERGDLVLEEGYITDVIDHSEYEQCTRMAFVIYEGNKYGPFSVEDFPENAQSTVQIEAFLDLVERVERDKRNNKKGESK